MRKRQQSGFALLLVFLMAAVIAITLYVQVPRVAFEAQRQKEQLLIERGEQYKRAIELFVRTNGRYPGRIEDLENFNNRRFLRHKFVDPMTGKDEWRLIHINAAGVFSDSLVNKPKQGDGKQEASTAGQYVGEQAGIGVAPLPGQQNTANPTTRRRSSEGGTSQVLLGPDGQPVPQGAAVQTTGIAPYPGIQPIPGGVAPVTGTQPYPVQPNFGGQLTQQAQPYPGQPNFTGQPGQQSQSYPGQPNFTPQPAQPFPGQPNFGQQPQPYPGGQPLPGMVTNAQPFPGAPPVPPEVSNMPGQPNVQAQPFQGRGSTLPPNFNSPFGTPGQQPVPVQSNAGQAYVGGNQPYVGGSQPYVGGGNYIGSQATTGAVAPVPGFPPTGFSPQFPGAPPSFPGAPVAPPTVAPVQQPQNATFPGSPGQNAATQMIQNILTNPRPATGAAPAQPGGQQIGGGIAGVASTAESPGIMIYNDRTKYNEWEFIFDFTKQKQVAGPNTGVVGTPAANLASPPTDSSTSPGANSNIAPGPQGQTAPNSPFPGGQPGTPAMPPEIRLGRP